MFNRQQKTVTNSTVHGSTSSSSSTVTRTIISSSATFHSQSSRINIQSSQNFGDPTVRETIKCFEELSLKQPQHTFRKNDIDSSKKTNTEPRTVPSSAIQTDDKFQLDCLDAHNNYRRKHGVGPLKLNPTLTNFAQNWANTIASKRQMQHSSERKYGENIYWASGTTVDGKVPVDSWYGEISVYNYRNASFSPGTGHFTQVVWKNSTDLGVERACVGNEVYVVASYYPPGNYSGEFSNNVFPPK